MIEIIYTMSDIRVIGNDIFYQGVKVGFVDEDSRQSLNFRDFLNDDIDTINDVILVRDSYNKTINIIMDMINELKKCRNFDGVKKTIRENDDEIKDLEQMTKDLDNIFRNLNERIRKC